MPIEDFVVPGISTAANIIGGAISRGQAKRDAAQARKYYEQDREYNEPKNQLARIHEAGLPSAAYFGGSASSQSQVYTGETRETDSGFSGAADSISKFQSTRLQRIAEDAAATNLEILKNQKIISDVETQEALKATDDPEFIKTDKTPTPFQIPRVVAGKRVKAMEDKAKLAASNLQNGLKSIELKVSRATTKEQIELVKNELSKLIQDALGAEQDTERKKTENIYLKDTLEFDKTIRDLRKAFWGKLRTGNMPSFREIVNIFLLAMENKLN